MLAQAGAKSLPRRLAHHAVRSPMHVESIAAAGSGVIGVGLQGNCIARDGGGIMPGGRDASACVSSKTIGRSRSPTHPSSKAKIAKTYVSSLN